jgi:FKBP-type peptidyl-prolyl cis-trans isomerase (trigger factor)
MTIERYLEMSGKRQDDLEKEMIPEAEKRVKIGLVLTEISKEIKAVVSEAEVHAEIERRIELTRQEEKPQAEEFYHSPEGHHQIENILVGEKVVNYLYDKCSK